jgi:hypothetical protein
MPKSFLKTGLDYGKGLYHERKLTGRNG